MNLFKQPLRVLIIVGFVTAIYPFAITNLLDGRGSPGSLPLYMLLSILHPVILTISIVLSILIIYQCVGRWRKDFTSFHKVLRVLTVLLSTSYLGYVGWVNVTFAKYHFNEDRYNKVLSKEDASDFITSCLVSQIYGTNDVIFLGTKSNPYSFLPVGYTPRVNRADIPALKQLARSAESRCGVVEFSVKQ